MEELRLRTQFLVKGDFPSISELLKVLKYQELAQL